MGGHPHPHQAQVLVCNIKKSKNFARWDVGRRGREDAWTSYVHFNLYIYIQWATNNNNFDTTSEIMFLALPPLGRQKIPKYVVSMGEKHEK